MQAECDSLLSRYPGGRSTATNPRATRDALLESKATAVPYSPHRQRLAEIPQQTVNTAHLKGFEENGSSREALD